MKTIAAMQRSQIKKIILLSLFGFFLAIIAVAFCYDDNAYLARSRSISQVRNVSPGAGIKIKVDCNPACIFASLRLSDIIILSTPLVAIKTTIFIPSQVVCIFPNKAPPVL